MEFKIDRKNFVSGLSKVILASDNRNKNRIFSLLQLEIIDSILTLQCTDRSITITEKIRVLDGITNGKILLPIKTFYNLVKSLKDDVIHVKYKEQLIINSSKGSFKFTINKENKLPTLVSTRTDKKIKLDLQLFKSMIDKILFTIPTADTYRPELMNCLIELDKKSITFVGTDGRKLGKTTYQFLEEDNNGIYLLPRKTISCLNIIIKVEDEGEIQLSFSNKHLICTFDNTTIITSLTQDKFPDYKRIIPAETTDLFIKTSEVEEVVSRVVLLSEAEHEAIQFSLSGLVTSIETPKSSNTSAYEELDCDWKKDDMSICISGKDMTSILGNITTEETLLCFANVQQPVVVKPFEYGDYELLYLLVPVRL